MQWALQQQHQKACCCLSLALEDDTVLPPAHSSQSTNNIQISAQTAADQTRLQEHSTRQAGDIHRRYLSIHHDMFRQSCNMPVAEYFTIYKTASTCNVQQQTRVHSFNITTIWFLCTSGALKSNTIIYNQQKRPVLNEHSCTAVRRAGCATAVQ
jgi:hypothetical protein